MNVYSLFLWIIRDFFLLAGDPLKDNLETIHEEAVDNLGHINHNQNEDTIDTESNILTQGGLPNCPAPNITYNGSLLSSGEVFFLRSQKKIFIIKLCNWFWRILRLLLLI